MVSCSDYQTCFDYTTMSEINKCLNGETHGPVHIMMGGEWNDPEQDFIVKAGKALGFTKRTLVLLKVCVPDPQ